jgi:large subunit ribosomal protein L23
LIKEERAYDIIIAPLVTEKNTHHQEKKKYVYMVSKRATKRLVKHSLQIIYKVNVLSVNIINVKGKVKMYKHIKGVRSNFKKAIVTVFQQLDTFQGKQCL